MPVGLHPIERTSLVAYQRKMKDHVYKLIELTGTSSTSIEDAIGKAIKQAHKTVKNLS